MAETAEDEILSRAGLARELIVDLPLVSRFVDGASRAWEVNQSAPGSSSQKVQSIFFDEDGAPGDAHVYAVSTVEGEMSARYTVNRLSTGSAREYMSDEAFLDEVASEMAALALAKGILEECPDEECGGLNPVDATECAVCGAKLGEEGEGSEAPENGQAAAANDPTQTTTPGGSPTEF